MAFFRHTNDDLVTALVYLDDATAAFLMKLRSIEVDSRILNLSTGQRMPRIYSECTID